MTKEELFDQELLFISKEEHWPAHYIYVKKGRESGWIFSGNHFTVYPVGGGPPLHTYASVTELLRDGWHVD